MYWISAWMWDNAFLGVWLGYIHCVGLGDVSFLGFLLICFFSCLIEVVGWPPIYMYIYLLPPTIHGKYTENEEKKENT